MNSLPLLTYVEYMTFLQAGLISKDGIIIDAKSGVSGAGTSLLLVEAGHLILVLHVSLCLPCQELAGQQPWGTSSDF